MVSVSVMGVLMKFFRDSQKNSDISAEGNEMFAELMVANNRRVFLAFLSIVILANLATFLIKLSGSSSAYLTYNAIILEFVIVSASLSGGTFLASRFRGKKISGYIQVLSVIVALWFFQYIIYGATELFAVHYIILALTVFYFDLKVVLFALIMVILSQTSLFILRPELVPAGAKSNIIVRYLIYLWVGISAAFGAGATRALMMLALEKSDEAHDTLDSLREVGRAVINSAGILKGQSTTQDEVADSMNRIAQQQAASLEEMSAAQEELAAQAVSVNSVAKDLNDEISVTVGSVADLKGVNERVQSTSKGIQSAIDEVTGYSSESSQQIQDTRSRFNTVQEKSDEMSNFVRIINDIADKVNLLSLNASIEAARAGDAGRGFAVVADEISKLAEATSENASHIERIINENASLIDESGAMIESSSEMMIQLSGAIDQIRNEAREMEGYIQDIDMTIKTIHGMNERIHSSTMSIENATSEQQIATEESSKTIQDISHSAQQLADLASRIAESTGLINELSEELNDTARRMEMDQQ